MLLLLLLLLLLMWRRRLRICRLWMMRWVCGLLLWSWCILCHTRLLLLL